MSAEAVEEAKNEEVAEIGNTEVIEDASPEARELRDTNEETQVKQNEEEIKQEEVKTEVKEEAKPKAKATPKKLPRTVKVVELVSCEACSKKMTPQSLKHTHPHYCKGQPTETLPVNKQKASYGSKIEQKLRKEIEEEMKKKYAFNGSLGGSASYENKENDKNAQNIQYSEPIEVKTKAKPVKMEEAPPPPRQLTARELLEASYNEIRKAKREAHIEKINSFKSKMF